MWACVPFWKQLNSVCFVRGFFLGGRGDSHEIKSWCCQKMIVTICLTLYVF